jgi:hypothetical protein
MSDQQNASSDHNTHDETIAVSSDGVAETTEKTETTTTSDSSGDHRVVNDDDAGTYTDVDLDPNDDTAAGTA